VELTRYSNSSASSSLHDHLLLLLLLLLSLLIPISFLLALEEFLVVFASVNNDHADVQLDGFLEKHSCNRELGVGDSFVKVLWRKKRAIGLRDSNRER
jgi:hypothetical protein